MTYETVIGLEVHAQLATQSKLFSGSTTAFGAPPNSQTSFIDAGFPGVLPVLNREAVTMAVQFGLAIGAQICDCSYFERKNYFYPDLPKGYQISQLQRPIVENGTLNITLSEGQEKTIRINRAHLEEDAGKSLHEDLHGYSGIDLNRAGTPLLEIVTEPDLNSAEEAIAYLKTLHHLVRYLGICDGNMQEGSFRCDVNLSLRLAGQNQLGTRTELKNLNSFKFIEKAIHCEVNRHRALLESGATIMQQTRSFDPSSNQTFAMRRKEEANDYRYFPDPDLLPIKLDSHWLADIQANQPELPGPRSQRLCRQFPLSQDEADYLLQDAYLADYFEQTHQNAPHLPCKLIINWLRGEMASHLNKHSIVIKQCPVSPKRFAQLLIRIDDDTLSGKMAKTVFESLWKSQRCADEIIKQQDLKQVSNDAALNQIIQHLIDENPGLVAQFREGKTKVLGFFVGQVMQKTQGKANPKQVNQLLMKSLKQS